MAAKLQYGELFVPAAGLAAGQCTWQSPSGDEDEMGTNHVSALNKLGGEGWQVVAVSDGPIGTRYVMTQAGASWTRPPFSG